MAVLKNGCKLPVCIFLAWFWCSTQLMCVKPWQVTNYTLKQTEAKLAMILMCELDAGAVGRSGCWA